MFYGYPVKFASLAVQEYTLAPVNKVSECFLSKANSKICPCVCLLFFHLSYHSLSHY